MALSRSGRVTFGVAKRGRRLADHALPQRYKVENLAHKDLGELHAVNYHEWKDPTDNNC
jgi:hypothetical protein